MVGLCNLCRSSITRPYPVGKLSITERDINHLCAQLSNKWSCQDVAKALGQNETEYDGKTNSPDEYHVILTTWLMKESDDCPKTCSSLALILKAKLNSEIKLKGMFVLGLLYSYTVFLLII